MENHPVLLWSGDLLFLGILLVYRVWVQESGTLSKEEAINFINERTQQLKEYIKNNPGETLPGLETRQNKALGSAPDAQAPLTLEESTTGPGVQWLLVYLF